MSDLNEGLPQEAVEELKPREGEADAEFAERVRTVERRLADEGYRASTGWVLPGEDGPTGALQRHEMIRRAREAEQAARPTMREEPKMASSTGASEFSKATADSRVQGQRREAEKAVAAFEGQAKKLYRSDGSRVYSAEEHQERHAELASEMNRKLSEITGKAEEDARSYEGTAKSYEYHDPAASLSAADRERLTASAPLVKEDAGMLPVGELVERLKAVRGGSDKLAKVLHARYARFRVRELSERRAQELASGAVPGNPSGEAARLRELEDLVSELEAATADPRAAEEQEKARTAARESRELLREVSRRRSEVDGSDQAARQWAAEATRAAF